MCSAERKALSKLTVVVTDKYTHAGGQNNLISCAILNNQPFLSAGKVKEGKKVAYRDYSFLKLKVTYSRFS